MTITSVSSGSSIATARRRFTAVQPIVAVRTVRLGLGNKRPVTGCSTATAAAGRSAIPAGRLIKAEVAVIKRPPDVASEDLAKGRPKLSVGYVVDERVDH